MSLNQFYANSTGAQPEGFRVIVTRLRREETKEKVGFTPGGEEGPIDTDWRYPGGIVELLAPLPRSSPFGNIPTERRERS